MQNLFTLNILPFKPCQQKPAAYQNRFMTVGVQKNEPIITVPNKITTTTMNHNILQPHIPTSIQKNHYLPKANPVRSFGNNGSKVQRSQVNMMVSQRVAGFGGVSERLDRFVIQNNNPKRFTRKSIKMNANISENDEHNFLIVSLVAKGIIKTDRVEEAMRKVDRAQFCNRDPYDDRPQSIEYNVTISAPHMHAYCLELMSSVLLRGCKVLDVGCGSGYLLGALHEMIGDGQNTNVVGIEHIEELTKFSVQNLSKSYQKELKSGQIKVVWGDGRKGYPDEAPYDAIHVGAAAPEVPRALINQLKVGGKLIIPVGPENGNQYIMQYVKQDEQGNCTQETLLPVRYVPLTSIDDQLYPLQFKFDLLSE